LARPSPGVTIAVIFDRIESLEFFLMASEGSVTRWFSALQEGDSSAAQQLWERYFQQLVALARQKLTGKRQGVADEEDVALSAFDSFCRNAEKGRFPRLLDRDSLWRLLMVITCRKAAHLIRDQGRLKRGGSTAVELSESDCLDQVLSREPDPEFAVEVAEQCERLLCKLADPRLERVALRRMEGYSVEEIAAELGCAPRSVKRKLQLIRGIWENEGGP
jgi:DNA-directed RNA polymerase specialized sigma24 family protein